MLPTTCDMTIEIIMMSSLWTAHHLHKACNADSYQVVGPDAQQHAGGRGWLTGLHAGSAADARGCPPVGMGMCGATG